MGLDGSLELSDVGTNNGLNLFTILEEDEGRHGRNGVLSGDIGALINVDLVEVGTSVNTGKLLNDGADHLARAAPGGVEVDNGKSGEGDFLLEFGKSLNLADHFR